MRLTWPVQLALRRPGFTLLATAVLTVVLGSGVLRLELRTDGEALRPRGDRVVDQDALDRARFRDPRAACRS